MVRPLSDVCTPTPAATAHSTAQQSILEHQPTTKQSIYANPYSTLRTHPAPTRKTQAASLPAPAKRNYVPALRGPAVWLFRKPHPTLNPLATYGNPSYTYRNPPCYLYTNRNLPCYRYPASALWFHSCNCCRCARTLTSRMLTLLTRTLMCSCASCCNLPPYRAPAHQPNTPSRAPPGFAHACTLSCAATTTSVLISTRNRAPCFGGARMLLPPPSRPSQRPTCNHLHSR